MWSGPSTPSSGRSQRTLSTRWSDPAAHDPLPAWLAYLHPAWMVASLTVAALALRVGLALRRSRRGVGRRTSLNRRAHLRLAKPAVGLLLAGFVAGPVSVLALRDWTPVGTFHGGLGVLVAGLLIATAVLGHRLETGRSRRFDAHALLGMLALLAAAVAAVAGFILLP
ncbi:MAG: DUF4079 family protein [Myxococcota bacterium]